MGRRWGKTVLGGALSLATASQGGRVAWIVPTYRNGRSLWRWAENATASTRKAGVATANKSERVIEFANGGVFGIYSADSEDSIRGEAFHLVILDEAARISETAWTDAIQPTLADYDGDAILISTPKGINWFHTEWQRGQDDGKHQASWTAPSSANPSPQIRRAAAMARERVPERTYRQEWMAEFVEDGAYFQGIDRAATVERPEQPEQHQGHALYMGVDWAMSEDYTVLTVGCATCARVVDWQRFNRIEFTQQRIKLVEMAQRWNAAILPERNSIGEPNIELLVDHVRAVLSGPDGRPGFQTTASSKPAMIQRLATALERGEFSVPREYAGELRSYEVETMASGHPRFGAPEGMHDDRVISLALCWWAITEGAARWYMS